MFDDALIDFYTSDNPKIDIVELGLSWHPGDIAIASVSFFAAGINTTLDLLDYVNRGKLDKFYISHDNIKELMDILEPVFAVDFDIFEKDPETYCFIR